MNGSRYVVGLVLWVGVGCGHATFVEAVAPADGGGSAVDAGRPDAGAVDAGGPQVDAGPTLPPDDAKLVMASIPDLGCTETRTATVRMRNTGSATWTPADYKLGAVDDSDPFTPTGRVLLTAPVPPGGEVEFVFPLTGAGAKATLKSDWRMVHESVRWFGEVAARDVTVTCAPPVNDFNLATVTVLGLIGTSNPDVRTFPATSTITSLEFKPDNIHVDHTKRGMWPPVVIAPDGTTQEATIWVFFRINGAWYGTGGERLRPNQTDKQLTKASDLGPGWLYDPNRWGVMTNYVPRVGELVGFMVVAGSTRSDAQTPVMERTKVVLIPFPADGVTAAFPPFFWQEP